MLSPSGRHHDEANSCLTNLMPPVCDLVNRGQPYIPEHTNTPGDGACVGEPGHLEFKKCPGLVDGGARIVHGEVARHAHRVTPLVFCTVDRQWSGNCVVRPPRTRDPEKTVTIILADGDRDPGCASSAN
jgi:hypothetical protein